MLKPLKGMQPEWFTPLSQLDEEGNPIDLASEFRVKPLDSAQLDQAMEDAKHDGNGLLKALSPKGILAALRFGLVEWRNFGENLKCNFTNHNKIPWVERNQIAMHIIGISIMPEDDEKN